MARSRRRVSGIAFGVVGISAAKLDFCDDCLNRLRLFSFAVKSLELIEISRCAHKVMNAAHLVLRGTCWDMSRRTDMSGGAAAVSSSESEYAVVLASERVTGGLDPFKPSCNAAKSMTSGSLSLIGPP